MNKSFTYYDSYDEAMSKFGEETINELRVAIIRYALYGTEPVMSSAEAEIFMQVIKLIIDMHK